MLIVDVLRVGSWEFVSYVWYVDFLQGKMLYKVCCIKCFILEMEFFFQISLM